MKVTAQFALWASIVFALICLGVAVSVLSQVDATTEAAARSDARGFAFFWLFLGAVASACGVVSWWIVRREKSNPSD